MKKEEKTKPIPTPVANMKTKKGGNVEKKDTNNVVEEINFKQQYPLSDTRVNEKPKLIDNPFNQDDFIDVIQKDNDNKIQVYPITCCIETCPEWDSAVQVTKWFNQTGYEIILNNKGTFQHLSITNEELDLVNKMVERLNSK